jgi:hypothetical protein
LLYSTLLHPVTVALPAVSAVDSARAYLLSAQNSSVSLAQNGTTGTSAHGDMQIGIAAAVDDMEAFAANIGNSTAFKEPKSGSKAKRALNNNEATPGKKAKAADVEAKPVLSVTKAPSVAPVSAIKAPTLGAAKPVKEVEAVDDDDESLPDIDIDADPDSD